MLLLSWHPSFILPLPKDHQFPMVKYEKVKDYLLTRTIVTSSNFTIPKLVPIEILNLVHTEEYIQKTVTGAQTEAEIRRIGFPYSSKMVRRERLICGAMIQAAENSLKHGISFNMAGGTHHAFAEYGSAYCIFNDMAVAAQYLLSKSLVQRVLIVDLDVHQGNGTASIFANKPNVFTFSMHGASSFPLKKQQSDCDIALPDSTNNEEYLTLLSTNLGQIIERFKPQIVLYQAGVDLMWCDKLGRISLTTNGIRERDRIVFEHCLSRNIPVAGCIGGGYASDINLIVEAHCNTIISAKEILLKYK